MNKTARIPAFPLITHDPYFSVWSNSDVPTGEDPVHWSGVKKRLRGVITIDGVKYRFLGRPTCKTMPLESSEVTPLSTRYTFFADGVRLTVTFTSPLLLDDPDILSSPITYIRFDTRFADHKKHDISIELWAFADLCHSGEYEPQMHQDFFFDKGLHYGLMGQAAQKVLSGSGDQVTCDWGYLFLASEEEIDEAPERIDVMLRYHKRSKEEFSSVLLIGYDDIASVNYFGRILPSYYARGGKTITQQLYEFYERKDEILSRCDAFDTQLLQKAEDAGGEDLRLIVSASYRQTIAAHKLVADTDGSILFISKENDSNGCAATVDVSYPSVPLFLLFNPELVRGMLRPILKFARMPVWTYDFAPHDAGRYPFLTGQVYGAKGRPKHQAAGTVPAPYYLYPASADAYLAERQMPLEESADMILMFASLLHADNDCRLAEENLDLLYQWGDYLVRYGEDPGEQLCTDDFTGHLKGNANLAVKAIIGAAAFSRILSALGREQDSEKYLSLSRQMAESWMTRAFENGHTVLAFGCGGWSIKYNLVWDRLLDLGLFPEELYRKELQSYFCRMNSYGLPLDSRASYSKTDWILWTSSMADGALRRAFISTVANYLRETESRVPFSDYYDTETGRYEKFIARSVQGGVFMPLLMDKWKKGTGAEKP